MFSYVLWHKFFPTIITQKRIKLYYKYSLSWQNNHPPKSKKKKEEDCVVNFTDSQTKVVHEISSQPDICIEAASVPEDKGIGKHPH